MANIGLLLAGGSGQRMQKDIPKQFLEIYGKPVLIYTLEAFQNHPEIDAIELVCIDSWQDYAATQAARYGITKLTRIVTGGASVQESIRNGVNGLSGLAADDDIVILHNGVQPLAESKFITNVIRVCEKYGNAVAALPITEQIFVTEDGGGTTGYLRRETLRKVVAPQAYRYDKLAWAYREAFSRGIGLHASSYANTLMTDLGEKLYFAEASEKNIKLTTQDDIDIFKALLQVRMSEEAK